MELIQRTSWGRGSHFGRESLGYSYNRERCCNLILKQEVSFLLRITIFYSKILDEFITYFVVYLTSYQRVIWSSVVPFCQK
jgi:hypothetical protein